MALGSQELAQIKSYQEHIAKICKEELKDEYNTFQYVTKNLGAWADETVIGTELKKDMEVLTKGIKALISLTESLNGDVAVLVEEQESLNKGIEVAYNSLRSERVLSPMRTFDKTEVLDTNDSLTNRIVASRPGTGVLESAPLDSLQKVESRPLDNSASAIVHIR